MPKIGAQSGRSRRAVIFRDEDVLHKPHVLQGLIALALSRARIRRSRHAHLGLACRAGQYHPIACIDAVTESWNALKWLRLQLKISNDPDNADL